MNKAQTQKIMEEIGKVISIVDVITSYGYQPVYDADDSMKMLCPFHNERTPSFKIYLKKNDFYCYGCGVGGNIIDFIARQEGKPKNEVLERFTKSIDVTSAKFAISAITKRLQKPAIDGNKYRQDMHFEMRVFLREWLKKHPGNEAKVDDCFREMRMFFFDNDNDDDTMIRKFSDYIINKVKT